MRRAARERSSVSVAIFAAQVNAFGWAIVFKRIKAISIDRFLAPVYITVLRWRDEEEINC